MCCESLFFHCCFTTFSYVHFILILDFLHFSVVTLLVQTIRFAVTQSDFTPRGVKSRMRSWWGTSVAAGVENIKYDAWMSGMSLDTSRYTLCYQGVSTGRTREWRVTVMLFFKQIFLHNYGNQIQLSFSYLPHCVMLPNWRVYSYRTRHKACL